MDTVSVQNATARAGCARPDPPPPSACGFIQVAILFIAAHVHFDAIALSRDENCLVIRSG